MLEYYTFIRLFSLSMEMRIIRDKTPDIVIVDPFEGVILANPDKDNFLVPYFPE